MNKAHNKKLGLQIPAIVEKAEDGFYVIECPLLEGCYSQGRSLDEAVKNVKEVIRLILEEKKSRDLIQGYKSKEFGVYNISL